MAAYKKEHFFIKKTWIATRNIRDILKNNDTI